MEEEKDSSKSITNPVEVKRRQFIDYISSLLRIPSNFSREKKLQQINAVFFVITTVMANVVYVLLLHLTPLLLKKFGRIPGSDKFTPDAWASFAIQDTLLVLFIFIFVIALIVKTNKLWALFLVITLNSICSVPLLFMLNQTLSFYSVSFVNVGITMLNYVRTNTPFRKTVVAIFLIYCALPPVAMEVYKLVLFLTNNPIERSWEEELIKSILDIVAWVMLFVGVFVISFFSKISNEYQKNKVRKLGKYLELSQSKKSSGSVRTKLLEMRRDVLDEKMDVFASDLIYVFRRIFEITDEMKSFMPDTQILSSTSSKKTKKSSRSRANSGESAHSDDSDEDSDDDSDEYEVDELQSSRKLFGAVEFDATVCCIAFTHMLKVKAKGESQKIHASLLKIVYDRSELFRGTLAEFTEDSFLVIFREKKSRPLGSRAIKFANAVKNDIKRVNEEMLSDLMTFIRSSISIHYAKLTNSILGNRKRRVNVFYGEAKEITRRMCQYSLRGLDSSNVKSVSSILATEHIFDKNMPKNGAILKDPIDILGFPVSGTTKTMKVYEVSISFEGSGNVGEHSWMLKSETKKDTEVLDEAFEDFMNDDFDGALEKAGADHKGLGSALLNVAKIAKEKKLSVKDCVGKVEKLKAPFTNLASVFDMIINENDEKKK